MANPHRGEVGIEIGGKERILKYDMNAIAEMEEHLGASVMSIFDGGGNVGLRQIRALLYFGMKGGDQSLTLKKVGEMCEMPKLGYYTEKILEAITLFFGPSEGQADESKNQAEP